MSYNLWKLSKKQAKEFELIYLKDFFEQNAFKLRKGGNSDFEFIKKLPNGSETIYFTHLEAFTGTRQEFYVLKEIKIIESHLENILKGLGQSISKHKNPRTVKFWKGSIDGINTNNYMPKMLNETYVASSCEIVKNFMAETGFSMLERFNDIKELDKEINGENFWTTDWQMPFDLGGDFDIKRMIIVKLSNNPNFDNIINYHLKSYDDLIATGEYVDLRNESKRQFEYAVEYLRNL